MIKNSPGRIPPRIDEGQYASGLKRAAVSLVEWSDAAPELEYLAVMTLRASGLRAPQ